MVVNRMNGVADQRLAEVIASFLQALEAGQEPNRQDLLDRHPDLATDLAEFFASRDQFDRLMAPLRAVVPAASLGGEHAPASKQLLASGARSFGDYELLVEIARGGMGVVYKARQISLNRVVALKMILAGQLATPADVQRFQSEAAGAANLDHANIVPIYEVGEHDGQHYFSMKLIEGGSLAQHLPQFAREQRKSAQLVATVARAIHHAHQRGMLHRDVKPANILLDAYGQPHVTDFGLAKLIGMSGASQRSRSGMIVGTACYMAPEQALGRERLTTTADVYSLGVILYELLTGSQPFRAESPLATLLQVREQEPKPPRLLNPQLDRDLETICVKCMEKDPERRYGSAKALAEDLERWLTGQPIGARPNTLWERGVKWAKRRPASAALVAISVLATVLVAALLGHSHMQTVQNLNALRDEQHNTKLALDRETRAREKAQEALLENARLTSEAMRIFNEVYATEVVERMKGHGIEVTHDYRGKPGAIPLPAILSVELAKRIAEQCGGKEIRLYSDLPFPWTVKDGGPRDDFEFEALRRLKQFPDKPYHRFETYGDRTVLRYATANRIGSSCIGWHNGHPQSPKTDWKEGDVIGVYEVILPVDEMLMRTAKGE